MKLHRTLTEFENFSGDWAASTFSPDGRFIVLGCPYDFDFRIWERGQYVEQNAAAVTAATGN